MSVRAEETFSTPSTSGTDSQVFDAGGLDEVVLYYHNTADTQVDFQVQVSHARDSSDDEWQDLGSVNQLSDGSSTKQTDFDTLDNEHNWIRVNVSANSADATSGEAKIVVQGQA